MCYLFFSHYTFLILFIPHYTLIYPNQIMLQLFPYQLIMYLIPYTVLYTCTVHLELVYLFFQTQPHHNKTVRCSAPRCWTDRLRWIASMTSDSSALVGGAQMGGGSIAIGGTPTSTNGDLMVLIWF